MKSLRTLETHLLIALIIALAYCVHKWQQAEARASYAQGKLDAYYGFEANVPSYKGLEKW